MAGPPGPPPPQAILRRGPGLVNADSALAYLRRMVTMGFSDKLHDPSERKVWVPDKKDKWTRRTAEK